MITDRRSLLALLAGSLATPGLARAASTTDAAMSPVTAYAFSFAGLKAALIRSRIRRQADPGRQHRVALRLHSAICRAAAALERYHERGLMIIGVPSNDFGGQEPGGAAESTRPRTRNMASPSRSPPRPRSRARTRIRSTNGRRSSGRWKRRAGTSTSIWSAATATSRPSSRRESSRWKRAWSTRWRKNSAASRPRRRQLPFSDAISGKNTSCQDAGKVLISPVLAMKAASFISPVGATE